MQRAAHAEDSCRRVTPACSCKGDRPSRATAPFDAERDARCSAMLQTGDVEMLLLQPLGTGVSTDPGNRVEQDTCSLALRHPAGAEVSSKLERQTSGCEE